MVYCILDGMTETLKVIGFDRASAEVDQLDEQRRGIPAVNGYPVGWLRIVTACAA